MIPLESFHVPARLARTVRSDRFSIAVDRDFEGVLDGCAEPQPGRTRTWINTRIRALYRKLYDIGHCHSIEAYENGMLAGGLYGVCLGRAFFGESMFHRERDASKVALVHLVARLKASGFTLLDTQFVTDHLRTFGAIEVSQRQYHKLLEAALVGEARFCGVQPRRDHERRRGARSRPIANSAKPSAYRRRRQRLVGGAVVEAAAAASVAAVRAVAAAGPGGVGVCGGGTSATDCGAPLQSVSQMS